MKVHRNPPQIALSSKLSLFQTGWIKNTPVWLNTSWYIYIPVKIQVLTQSEKATSLPVRSFKKGLGFTGTVAIGPGSPAPSFSADADSLIPWFIIHISVYIEVIYHTLNQLPATSSLEAKIFLVPSGVMLDSRDRSNCMYESIYVRQKRSLPICKLIVVS